MKRRIRELKKRLRETRVRQTFRDLEIHNDRNKTKSGQTEQ